MRTEWVSIPPGPLYGKRIVMVKKDNKALIVELDTHEEFRFAFDEMSNSVRIQAKETRKAD